jgi:hypothetical protein
MVWYETWQQREDISGRKIPKYRNVWTKNLRNNPEGGMDWTVFVSHKASEGPTFDSLTQGMRKLPGLNAKPGVFEFAVMYARDGDIEGQIQKATKTKVFCGATENVKEYFSDPEQCISPLKDFMIHSLKRESVEKKNQARAILLRIFYTKEHLHCLKVRNLILNHADYAWNADANPKQRNISIKSKNWISRCLPCIGSIQIKTSPIEKTASLSETTQSFQKVYTSGAIPRTVPSEIESDEYFWSIAIVSIDKTKGNHTVDYIRKDVQKPVAGETLKWWLEGVIKISAADGWGGVKDAFCYNDQPPPDGVRSNCGHCKGVLKVNTKKKRIGWLAHSVPHWPEDSRQVTYDSYKRKHPNDSHHQHMSWFEFPYSKYLLNQIYKHIKVTMKAHIYGETGMFKKWVGATPNFNYYHTPLSMDGNLVHIAKEVISSKGEIRIDSDDPEHYKDDFQAAVEFGDIFRYLRHGFVPGDILINSWFDLNGKGNERHFEIIKKRQKEKKNHGKLRRSVSMTDSQEPEKIKKQNSHCKLACPQGNAPYAFMGDLNDDPTQHTRGGGFFVLRSQKAAEFLQKALRGDQF